MDTMLLCVVSAGIAQGNQTCVLAPPVSLPAARVMFSKHKPCQAQTLPTPKTCLALRIKSQVFAESLLGAPFVLVTTSPVPLCLRHLGLPSVFQTGQLIPTSGPLDMLFSLPGTLCAG